MCRFHRLNVEIHDIERVFLDEFAALLDVFAHQRRENILGSDGVFESNLAAACAISAFIVVAHS